MSKYDAIGRNVIVIVVCIVEGVLTHKLFREVSPLSVGLLAAIVIIAGLLVLSLTLFKSSLEQDVRELKDDVRNLKELDAETLKKDVLELKEDFRRFKDGDIQKLKTDVRDLKEEDIRKLRNDVRDLNEHLKKS